MKKNIFILSCFLAFGCIAKGDTIDYWHVYYNNVKIKEFNQYSNGLIQLEIGSINSTDTLLVNYFQDTPCNFCENILYIEDEEHKIILHIPLFNHPAAIPLKNLLDAIPPKTNGIFSFFYQKDATKYPLFRYLLFRVTID